MKKFHQAPFIYFGGKRKVVDIVWERFGNVTQYIEPFCGSAAMLLGNKSPASLEVINDMNFYISNFWRCIKYNYEETFKWQDYPVVHIDLSARHNWLTEPKRTEELKEKLSDPDWPGDPKIAGWWVWGQCAWIGSGWCEKENKSSQIPHVGGAGRGVHSQIPHVGGAGRGVHSQIPHVGGAGRGVLKWFETLSNRLHNVRVLNGSWDRCLNNNYGGKNTALFLDPPYKGYEKLYQKGSDAHLIADDVEAFCRDNKNNYKIALCGFEGDYNLPGWDVYKWSRNACYGSNKTAESEIILFSPLCEKPLPMLTLFE